jgi:hypothetical protein
VAMQIAAAALDEAQWTRGSGTTCCSFPVYDGHYGLSRRRQPMAGGNHPLGVQAPVG